VIGDDSAGDVRRLKVSLSLGPDQHPLFDPVSAVVVAIFEAVLLRKHSIGAVLQSTVLRHDKRQRISPLFALARPGYVFGRMLRSIQTELQKVCHPQYDLATSMRRTLEHFMGKPSLF
jgi:hypothetical protein